MISHRRSGLVLHQHQQIVFYSFILKGGIFEYSTCTGGCFLVFGSLFFNHDILKLSRQRIFKLSCSREILKPSVQLLCLRGTEIVPIFLTRGLVSSAMQSSWFPGFDKALLMCAKTPLYDLKPTTSNECDSIKSFHKNTKAMNRKTLRRCRGELTRWTPAERAMLL